MEITRQIPAAADLVWEQLATTRHWPHWGPTVTAVEPADATVTTGMTGRVRTPAGLWLPFTVTAVEPGTSWSWQVAGVPATGHRVEEWGAACRATFTVPRWAPFYLPVCRIALDRIADAVTA